MNAYFLDVVLHFIYRHIPSGAGKLARYRGQFIKKHKLFQIISYRIKVINIEFIGNNLFFFPSIVTKTSFDLSKNFKMYKFKRNVRRIYTFFDVCYIGNAGYVLNIFLQSPHLHIRHESSNEAFLLLQHTNWFILSLSVLINIWF